MAYETDRPIKYISITDVCEQTTLGKSCIYDKIASGEFPKPRQLTPGRVAWVQSEVSDWALSRPVATADIAA